MPEYLAPGVYVEEVDSGNKPIEGVSTSTAGVVGVTERGPRDVAVLLTSYGEFQRIFGQTLDADAFTSNGRGHNYLPHAVEGFFSNRGRRIYVTRVAPEDATHASRTLFDRGSSGGADTVVLRAAAQDTGTSVHAPSLYVADASAITVGERVRIGDGSRAEYREVAGIGTGATHLALASPLVRPHEAGVALETYDLATTTAAATTPQGALTGDIQAGSNSVEIDFSSSGVTPTAGDVALAIGDAVGMELRRAALENVTGDIYRASFEDALVRSHSTGELAVVLDLSAGATSSDTLDLPANTGDLLIYSSALATATTTAFLAIDGGDEYVRIGALGTLSLDVPLHGDHPTLSAVRAVSLEPTVTSIPATKELQLDSVDGLTAGMAIELASGPMTIASVDTGSNLIAFASIHGNPAVGTAVRTAARALDAGASAGAIVLHLDNREDLQVGTSPDEEYAVVAEVDGNRSISPDAGTVILESPLRESHANGSPVWRLLDPRAVSDREPTSLVLAADADSDELLVSYSEGYATDDIVELTTPSGQRSYHRLDADAVSMTSARELELGTPVGGSHEVGTAVAERVPLLTVQALDVGGWGDRLRISCQDESNGLASRAQLVNLDQPGRQLWLTTVTGVEAGTVLALEDPDTGEQIGDLLKVRAVDRANNNLVQLDSGPTADHVTAHTNAAAAGTALRVRSREFRLTVHLLRRPDPAVPSRNDQVIDSEVFANLSMDHRHSRYVETVIGRIEPATGEELRRWDRRTVGESAYIRVADEATGSAGREVVRLGPEALVDIMSSGRQRAARHPLTGGGDSVATISDATYIGETANEPEERTGLFTLTAHDDISLVAIPGQTSTAIQQALIDHCENDRYRFAVLDGQGPPDDTLVDVQTQRQQFDSKYAAMYHPWLLIPDPSPSSLSSIQPLAIPPSGHVLGIFARTDVERGVHKAPANEVVRGIVGVQRSLNKAEQDILNPFPVNINVIRDFRRDNRGIRVWGARNITSDSALKYVNVRRLLIFLQESIERGLQWVVFEPNYEKTWARVRRSIVNFLTVVWRNGALEGSKPEEAFFARCDRTTMTQTDIDSGRLIAAIGVAPVKPAEYVIIRIGLWTAHADD